MGILTIFFVKVRKRKNVHTGILTLLRHVVGFLSENQNPKLNRCAAMLMNRYTPIFYKESGQNNVTPPPLSLFFFTESIHVILTAFRSIANKIRNAISTH